MIFLIQGKQIFLSISSSYVRIAAKYLQIAASICIQMCKLTSRRLSKKLIKWEKLGSVIREETKVERDYYSIAKRKFENSRKANRISKINFYIWSRNRSTTPSSINWSKTKCNLELYFSNSTITILSLWYNLGISIFSNMHHVVRKP